MLICMKLCRSLEIIESVLIIMCTAGLHWKSSLRFSRKSHVEQLQLNLRSSQQYSVLPGNSTHFYPSLILLLPFCVRARVFVTPVSFAKQLNQSRYSSQADSYRPTEPCGMRCTLAPPGKYQWTICAGGDAALCRITLTTC